MNDLNTIRPELLTVSRDQALLLLPLIIMVAGSLLAIILGAMKWNFLKKSVFWVFVATVCGAMNVTFHQLGAEPSVLFNGMMVVDQFSKFFNLIFLGTALFTAAGSIRFLKREEVHHPEFFILMFFAAIGMMLLVSSFDLIVLFIALELMSISVYVLVGFRRVDRRSNEAAMKYFLLGSAGSALLLYGTALVYGGTGSTNLRAILAFIQSQPQPMGTFFVLGAWLAVIGFLFKVASVPFHMWMPDVYEGAPTPVAAFMATGLKAAAFAAFIRVLLSTGYGAGFAATLDSQFRQILWISAVLTMAIGNVIALTQTNLKRMLGYSSIAHTGYILVGIIAGPRGDQGFSPVVFYLVVYSIMNLGAFLLLSLLGTKGDTGLNLHDLAGLSRQRPWLAFSMAVFLFSLAGVPPTAGFTAKYLLFYSAVQAGEVPLVVISVLCTAISVYYYLRVLVYMYMRDPAGKPAGEGVSWGSVLAALTVGALVALTVQIGVLPAPLVSATKKAIATL